MRGVESFNSFVDSAGYARNQGWCTEAGFQFFCRFCRLMRVLLLGISPLCFNSFVDSAIKFWEYYIVAMISWFQFFCRFCVKLGIYPSRSEAIVSILL